MKGAGNRVLPGLLIADMGNVLGHQRERGRWEGRREGGSRCGICAQGKIRALGFAEGRHAKARLVGGLSEGSLLGSDKLNGRRPTLPHTYACSTIGAEGLNYRVRDGNGWNPLAMVTQSDFGKE